MIRKKGDMFSVFDQVDHFIVCVGSNLRSLSHEAIMLNGLAGQLVAKYPQANLPKTIGQWLFENGHDCGIYGIRVNAKLGIFQHIISVSHGVNLGVISMSAKALAELATANPDKRYALEAPNYKEPWFLVEGPLSVLPDNVEVWEPE